MRIVEAGCSTIADSAKTVTDRQAGVPQQPQKVLKSLLHFGQFRPAVQTQQIYIGKRRQLRAAITAGGHNCAAILPPICARNGRGVARVLKSALERDIEYEAPG